MYRLNPLLPKVSVLFRHHQFEVPQSTQCLTFYLLLVGEKNAELEEDTRDIGLVDDNQPRWSLRKAKITVNGTNPLPQRKIDDSFLVMVVQSVQSRNIRFQTIRTI
jgi:hypothetical protein